MADAPHDTDATPPSSARRWARILLWVLGVGVLLFLASSFAVSRLLDPDRLAGWLEPRIEEAVNRDVEVGAVEVGFLPLAVRLRTIAVSDPTGLAPRLAALDNLELRVRVLPLLRREIRVSQIRLVGLEANLRAAPDGLNNYGDFSPAEGEESDAGEEARPFALQLDAIRLSGGTIRFQSASDSLDLSITELEAVAAVSHVGGGPWVFDGDYSARVSLSGKASGEARPPLSTVPVRLRMAAETSEDFSEVTVHEGSLELEEVSLGVRGRASNLKEPVRRLELEVQARGVALADLLALLPDSVREARSMVAGGTLAGDLTVHGQLGPDAVPEVEGAVEVQSGSFRLSGMTLLENLDATLDLSADRSVRPRARGTLLGGDLDLTGAATLGAEPRVDLRVQMEPALDQIHESFLPVGLTLQGRLPSQLRVVGNPMDLASLRYWGDLGVRGLVVTHPNLGVPVRVGTGSLALEGDRATVAPTTVVLGDDPIDVRGTLTGVEGLLDGAIPDFRGSASGTRVSLVELRAEPPADTSLTYGRVAFARVGGRPVRGRSAESAAQEMGLRRPGRLPLAGQIQVALDTVLDQRGRMEDVTATLVFGPDFLQVTEAAFRRYGGRIRTTAALELGDEAEEPFSLNLVAEGVDAGAFLGETTPLGRAITGTLDLDLDVAGALDALLLPSRSSLQGSGSFSLTGGGIDPGPLGERLATFLGQPRLAAPSIRDWSTGFILSEGRILLQEARMDGAPGAPRVGGGVGLDGDLDLVTAFDLPREELGAAALERLGLPPGSTGMQMVSAVLRVGGSLMDPSVSADPRATVESVAGAVEDRAREELETAVQERQQELRERATGFLRGLLRGRDTTRAAPPDSLVPDSIRPDTIGPDTIRPDTIRPDTVRPDTTQPDTVRRDTTRSGASGTD
jgi:hypothetical protein